MIQLCLFLLHDRDHTSQTGTQRWQFLKEHVQMIRLVLVLTLRIHRGYKGEDEKCKWKSWYLWIAFWIQGVIFIATWSETGFTWSIKLTRGKKERAIKFSMTTHKNWPKVLREHIYTSLGVWYLGWVDEVKSLVKAEVDEAKQRCV